MNKYTEEIQKQINSVIIGKETVVAKVLMAILARGHVLLDDVPGVGKTTLAISFAKTLGLETKRVQFTSDTMPSDIIGFSVYNKASGAFEYKAGAVMTNLLLADEINHLQQDAVRASGGHGGISDHGRWKDAQAAESLRRHCDTEPGRLRRHAAAAQLPARPIPDPDHQHGLSGCASQISILRDRHRENPLDKLKPVLKRKSLKN